MAANAGSLPPGHSLFRALLPEDEVKALLELGRSVTGELPAALAASVPAVGAPTQLYAPILKDETVWLRPVDVKRWVLFTGKAGVAYATALRVEKDRALGVVDRGTSQAWDDLLDLGDLGLLSVGVAAALYGAAFITGESLQDCDLTELGNRAHRIVDDRAPLGSSAVPSAAELFRRLPNAPSNGVGARGLLELVLLVALTEALAAKAEEALGDPGVLYHVGLPHNPGLQFDRLRRALASVSRFRAILELCRSAGEPPMWERHDLPGRELFRMS